MWFPFPYLSVRNCCWSLQVPFFKLTTGHTFSVQSCWVWFVPLPSIIILMCLGFYWPRAGMLSTAVNTPCDICSQILSLYNYMNKQTSCVLQKEFTKFIKFIEENIKFSLSCCKDTTTEEYRTFWNKRWLCSFLSEIRKKIRFSPHHVLGQARGAAAQTLVPVQWCGGGKPPSITTRFGRLNPEGPLRTVVQRNLCCRDAQKCHILKDTFFRSENEPKPGENSARVSMRPPDAARRRLFMLSQSNCIEYKEWNGEKEAFSLPGRSVNSCLVIILGTQRDSLIV